MDCKQQTDSITQKRPYFQTVFIDKQIDQLILSCRAGGDNSNFKIGAEYKKAGEIKKIGVAFKTDVMSTSVEVGGNFAHDLAKRRHFF